MKLTVLFLLKSRHKINFVKTGCAFEIYWYFSIF